MNIITRVRKYVEENGLATASVVKERGDFEDLTIKQIANALRSIRYPDRDREYHRKYPRYLLWRNAKHRSVKKNLYFDIVQDDIEIPTSCPILGIPLHSYPGKRGGGPASPTIDRIDPRKGYTRDNIHVISKRANQLKNDATVEELKKICAWIMDYVDL